MSRKKWISFFKKYGVMIIGIVCTVLFLYSENIFGEYQLSFTNLMYESSPWNTLGVKTDGPVLSDVIDSFTTELYTTIKDGSIGGLWDPDIALGTESNISSWLYPLNYIYILPLNIATVLRTGAEFLIAFFGMYFFIRSLECKKFPAAIAGVTYCFSSVIVMWLGWQHSDVAALAPFAFFFFEKFLKTVKIKYCFGLILTVYFMLVAGMPTYAAYFLYILAAYVFFRTIWIYRKEGKKILIIFPAVFIAVLLAVVCSLPYTGSLLSSVGANGYAGSRAGRAGEVLPWEYLSSLVLPYIRVSSEFHMNESTIYVGLAAILVFFFSFLNFKKKKNSKFWLISLLVIFLLIFTHVFDSVYKLLPAVNTSSKFRIITLFNFAGAVLLGLNLQDLVENREYYLRHKIRYFFCLLLGGGALCYGYIWTYLRESSEEYYEDYKIYIITATILFLLLAAVLIRKIKMSLIMTLLCTVVIFNMASFAKDYFPEVEKGTADIPEATDTIEYLQNNTEYERIAATGSWTLFPNTGVYYGLDDIRGHNFVFTNEDMKTYYTAMAGEEGLDSPTRFILPTENVNDINENLLKYLGTKYLVIANEHAGDYSLPGFLSKDNKLEQEIQFQEDSPQAIRLLAGTYQTQYEAGDRCILEILEEDTGDCVYRNSYDMRNIKDNTSFLMKLDGNTLKKDTVYILRITTNTSEEKPLTFYLDRDNWKLPNAYYNDLEADAPLAVEVFGKDDYIGEDGLVSRKLDEYTDRVELADAIEVYDNDEEVLRRMEDSFDKNMVFLEREEAEKISSWSEIGTVKENDQAVITEHTDDRVVVKVTTGTSKILILNEYYNPDWKVYVNGDEQELIKCNYLFRGVEVPEGQCTVEFRYEPTDQYVLFALGCGSLTVIVILAGFSIRIQKRIDRKILKKGRRK